MLLRALLPSLALALDLPTKRGLAYVGNDHESDNSLLLDSESLISWYYTWSPYPARPIGRSLEFIPLLHGLDDTTSSSLDVLDTLPDSSTHLMTFNEPDGSRESGGSDISPRDAARAYVDNVVPLRTARREWKIAQPAVTGSGYGLEWLREFNEECERISDDGCPADFVALHWYGNFVGLASWLGQIKEFYDDLFEDDELGYWITEMALPQQDEQATFAMMNESLAYLDGLDYVRGYAWFGAFREDEGNEWTGEEVAFFDGGGGLTRAGALYLGGEERGFEEGMDGGAGVLAVSRWLWVVVGGGMLICGW